MIARANYTAQHVTTQETYSFALPARLAGLLKQRCFATMSTRTLIIGTMSRWTKHRNSIVPWSIPSSKENEMPENKFSVVVYYTNGKYEYVIRFVDMKTVLQTVANYLYHPLADRIIITDGGDCTVFACNKVGDKWTAREAI